VGFLTVFFRPIKAAVSTTDIKDTRMIPAGNSGIDGVGLTVGSVWAAGAAGDGVGVLFMVGLVVGCAVGIGVGDAVGEMVATGELCQFQVMVESWVIAKVTDVPLPDETEPVPDQPVQVQTRFPSVIGLTTL
jgi:hypothetical protein